MFAGLISAIDERFWRIVAFVRDTVPDGLVWAVTQSFQTYAAIVMAGLWGYLAGKFGVLTASLAVLAMVVLAVLV